MTKFQDKFASLPQVNGPNSWDKFQICCTDMHLIRFLPNCTVLCVFCWILRDFTDLPEFHSSATAQNIRSPAKAEKHLKPATDRFQSHRKEKSLKDILVCAKIPSMSQQSQEQQSSLKQTRTWQFPYDYLNWLLKKAITHPFIYCKTTGSNIFRSLKPITDHFYYKRRNWGLVDFIKKFICKWNTANYE